MRFVPRLIAALLFCWGLVATPALAISLEEAKAQGLVGERVDGFVGAVVADPPTDVATLVEQINAERRQKYTQIAAERDVPIDAVAQIVGERQVERAAAGEYVAGADGRWRQK